MDSIRLRGSFQDKDPTILDSCEKQKKRKLPDNENQQMRQPLVFDSVDSVLSSTTRKLESYYIISQTVISVEAAIFNLNDLSPEVSSKFGENFEEEKRNASLA